MRTASGNNDGREGISARRRDWFSRVGENGYREAERMVGPRERLFSLMLKSVYEL